MSIFTIFVDSGAVGECRSECVERNLYKIVRVHLKEDLVMVGICKNTSTSSGSLSIVVPFICHRNHGIWIIDDSVGLSAFSETGWYVWLNSNISEDMN
ncbi:hypothetical protein DICVIV_03633 [Dictyocaulus viviparus]|uniref:Uncharacterized protein n=1 Tax=Dictyocaulus viviparus TaxID=29172 RepID=A0A0D8Y2F5_DICVI|nr:hypothetical protein DICVIV_03633 [Dictyocaulus viviparus]